VTNPAAGFSAPTQAWFSAAFAAPTRAQTEAWTAIRSGDHALVVAPTGSGKTLAAFLWSLDRLITTPVPTDPAARCQVLYVSPLKALAADVERNLRSPLVGIRQAGARLGVDVRDLAVGMRTGDTPPTERRAFATRPPDILITTPESLYLVLTSVARAGLAGVRTVIVDEIHAVAGTKRGAHLALSLERLDALLEGHGGPAQRIGLSATVRPVATVARFLGGFRAVHDGGRPVTVVQPPSTKQVVADVVVPVPDLTELDPATGGDDTAAKARRSLWPHVEERIVDLVAAHRSTLVFTNSRRGAERLTARMNEVWATRRGEVLPEPGSLRPSQMTAQSGAAVGIDTADASTILARAHHGSMSRAERTRTETELKSGRLPAVVATSSLELGIDMGAVDLVIQVGSPPSVASGLQRVGRAGHQVGAVSRGVLFPTFRGDLVPTAVIAGRMRAGQIEELTVPANPLDVLAQQIVAMVAVQDWTVDGLTALVRRAAPFSDLGDGTARAVLDMLAGRYPSEDFAELRPRILWDRTTDVLSPRPGALRLAVTSGGTIPDRGLYGVFLAGVGADETDRTAWQRGGKRVGELDEEMVYESRVGDTFTLGSSTWRIEQITPDQVLVSPAPGQPGRLPFWKGDAPGRPAELGRAVGAWVRELSALGDGAAARLAADGLDDWAAQNLLAYLAEQRAATGRLPDDATIVVERFRDEIGDWRVVIHSPYGARVHGPWALVLAARLRERYGLDAAAMHSDDGIVLRLPDRVDSGAGAGAGTWDVAAGRWSGSQEPVVELADLLIDPDDVAAAVRDQLAGSAHFGARFREAAARALLLPRRRPDRRQPLWQQRQRSAQLLSVAARFPDFPVLLEAARECLQDDFDVAALTALMHDVVARRVRVVEVTTATPSPFARSLLFGYTAQFLYEGDAPLAERRAAALTLDPTLLAELLGQPGAAELAELLDPGAVERTEAELTGTAPERRARSAEDVADMLRRHGPLGHAEIADRTRATERPRLFDWLTDLAAARRLILVRVGDRGELWAAVEDAGRLRDGLGVALPVGVPEVFTEPVVDPLGDLVRRHARTNGPFTAADVATRFGLGPAVATEVLRHLEAAGALVVGRIRPAELGGTGEDFCDTEVLRTLRRRSLAALRAEVEPVPPETLGLFLPHWQGVEPGSARLGGPEGLVRVVEQLAGYAIPASALETLVLPARLPDYDPRLLDELIAAGEVLWAGHGSLTGTDGVVSLHPAATADLTLAHPAEAPDTAVHGALLGVLGGGGGYFLPSLVDHVLARLADEPPEDFGTITEALWDLVWTGLVTNDSLSPLRSRLGARRSTAHPVRRPAPRGRTSVARLGLRPGRPEGRPAEQSTGRWALLPARETDPTLRAHALAAQLLDRHGVLTRAVAPSEGVAGQFGGVYRVLAALEAGGQVRRGYFVEHLGGSQFALLGAVDQVRDAARSAEGDSEGSRATAVVLAATDPANPYGAALAWPEPETSTGGHRPGRKAGGVVVLVNGRLVLYLERGGRTLLSFSSAPTELLPATTALAAAARAGRLGRITLSRADGAELLDREVLAGPLATALAGAGFGTTPRGLRLRPDARG
jgi:ATP-dependent Lhr-like helicase